MLRRSHHWRSDVSSFISINGSHRAELKRHSWPPSSPRCWAPTEVWVQDRDYVSDECAGCTSDTRDVVSLCPNPRRCGWNSFHGYRAHEQRFTNTPSQANLSFFPDYDWILYADAEVVWFTDSVRRMVADLDPSLPWFIHEPRQGTVERPAQALCAFPGRPAITRPASGNRPACILAPTPSPSCTVASIFAKENCAYGSAVEDKAVLQDGTVKPNTSPPSPCWSSGDAGMLISRGAMAAISVEQWRD